MYSDLFDDLKNFSQNCINEEELRSAWVKAFSKIGIDFKPRPV